MANFIPPCRMVEIFTLNIQETLDEVAPYKTFTVKSQYKFGLSEKTKDLMTKRVILSKIDFLSKRGKQKQL